MNRTRSLLKAISDKLVQTGFYAIFFSNVAAKVLTFLGGIVIVRILSKNDYGQYTYVMNCYEMLVLLGDLGCAQAAMQMCSENYQLPGKFNSYFVYGTKKALLFSGVTALALLASPLFYPFRYPEAARLTQMMCLLPFLSTGTMLLQINLRVRLANDLFAKQNIAATAIHYLVILPMSYFLGYRGAVFSNYVINLLSFLYALRLSRELLDYTWRDNGLQRGEKRTFLKLAFASQLNSAISTGLTLLDVFLIGLFIADNEVISSYKVAITIPNALVFIPQSIILYVAPHFARHNQELAWVRKNYFRLILLCTGFSLILSAGCILCAPWMIPFVFGRQYTDAVPCFIILMVGFIFSAGLQIPSANVIYTQHKVRVNIAITILSGIANCILDVILILHYGSIGAAAATAAVHAIGSLFGLGYMCYYLRSAKK